ncbi:MAG: hypothetical protein GY801_16420 [bacterium]|nr:hypothetical protein [bacterium]
MAQCKKILDSGERCSNRAEPGSEFCQEHHKRVLFRKVASQTFPQPEPSPKETPAQSPQWKAFPSALGAEPAFPGLQADSRHILVGPQGLVWLRAQSADTSAAPLLQRLLSLLAALSQYMPLPGHVTIQQAADDAGMLLRLTPPPEHHHALSAYYDTVATAAALSDGALYVGASGVFIHYRDGDAPRGYDAVGVEAPPGDNTVDLRSADLSRPTHPPAPSLRKREGETPPFSSQEKGLGDEFFLQSTVLPPGETIRLVDSGGTHPLSPDMLRELPLQDALLRIRPLPLHGAELPDTVFVLAAAPLYRLLATYFREHYLRFRIARFVPAPSETSEDSTSRPLLLFELTAQPDAPAGAFVPRFVLSYLMDLPFCVVFHDIGSTDTQRMLVEWGRRYPCLPRHILPAFPADSLVLLCDHADFSNMCLSPMPVFLDGDTALSVPPLPLNAQQFTPIMESDDLQLEIPVRLVPDSGPVPAPAALVLDDEEMGWVSRLLYRLPGELFTGYSVCLGEERAVLIGEGLPLEILPFGIPLRRVQDTSLFLPLRARLMPELPWNLLATALDIQERRYTLLTPEFRLDVPCKAFAPLSKALVAEPGRPNLTFTLKSGARLPELRWSDNLQELRQQLAASRNAAPIEGRRTVPSRQENRADASPEARDERAGAGEQPPAAVSGEVEQVLRERAAQFQAQEDYLSAAVCFAICGDSFNAARCYQSAAHALAAS